MALTRAMGRDVSVCGAALGGVEYAVLQDAVYNLRCCIATAGGGVGASARGDCWPILHGGITVWLGA